ncbi:hypothetical protein D3C72_1631900 [compost metagenome]
MVIARNTSAAPAAAPGAARRKVISHSARAGERPRLRAMFSSSTGAWAMPARRLTRARGKNINRYASSTVKVVWYIGRAKWIVTVTSASATIMPGKELVM